MARSVLELARGGDEQAFGELVQPYRRELQLHCYRMLGSLVDAEDALQDTLVAAWQGLSGFGERSTLRAWLYRIATNRCLNVLRYRRRRVPTEPVPPFEPPDPSHRADVRWVQPCPDAWMPDVAPDPTVQYVARETVGLAFVTALQGLPPRQVAVLVLCDVMDFSMAEVAEMLGTSSTSVKGALQRARASVARHRAAPAGRPVAPGSRSEREFAERFAEAFTADDVDRVVALLTDGAWLAMPPAPHEYWGREAVRTFLVSSAAGRDGRRLHLVPTRANGQPAFGVYLDDPREGAASFNGVLVLTMADDAIAGITRFLDVGLSAAFGLSPRLVV